MNSTAPEVYCREKAASAGTSFYYSTLYYSTGIKRELFALHAFHREIELVIEECSDPGVAHMKFAWWMEEIQRLFAGSGRHPVSRELTTVNSQHEISKSVFLDLIHHYEQRINPVLPDSYQGLIDFLERGPGLLWKFSASICGFRDQGTPEIICRLGSLFGFFYLLQDRRINQLLSPELQDDYLQRLISDIKECYRKVPLSDHRSQTGALIMANIITQTADEIVRDGHYPARQRTSLTPLRKFWIAWRTHRKVMSGK